MEQSAADAEIQAAKVDMGLKLGYRQVGVRQKSQPRVRIWRATSVPRGVDIEDAENIMTAGGFSNFEALEKFRWKQDSGYVFKAVRSDPQDVFTITSSTAQGGGGSFKNRKPIGEIGCCESPMAGQKH